MEKYWASTNKASHLPEHKENCSLQVIILRKTGKRSNRRTCKMHFYGSSLMQIMYDECEPLHPATHTKCFNASKCS